jgi:hypothetical protein
VTNPSDDRIAAVASMRAAIAAMPEPDRGVVRIFADTVRDLMRKHGELAVLGVLLATAELAERQAAEQGRTEK